MTGTRPDGASSNQRRSRSIVAGAVLVAASLAACSNRQAGVSNGPQQRPAPTAQVGSPATSSPRSAPAATATGGPSPGPPGESTAGPPAAPAQLGLRNLAVTAAVRQQLVQAYLDNEHYQASWISGTDPGSVYYAYDPATGSHLAWAGFTAAAGAPARVLVGMQDAGTRTAFRQTAGVTWQVYDICSTPAFLALIGGRLPADGHC